ncbi:protein PHYTOCHROME-DEPENDENT LATE-FLOWERING-like [Cornus florida]|uniref:protein PHYTOCHROME-DEPENDENT LATE-FLOWERING-like n=1 Tax=Cornus florida TaxID=4283 RepID=UPI00289728AC|nr:protein PHYTOCHROME-DEPENDENT LATE-FLOWERING-like [Cornus florida]
MGVSFKVAKAGTRYRPKQGQTEEKEIENDSPTESQQREKEGDLVGVGDKVAGHSNALAKRRSLLVSEDFEVSFSLNLFPDGFSIGKANESLNVVSRQLHPYDRASETLFCAVLGYFTFAKVFATSNALCISTGCLQAIECGCLPGDIFDDIPCKYVNGALICEIRDYRNILSQKGNTVSSAGKSPIIHKVVLQMCMENIVKDVSSISDDSWTYKDLLEVEARILKTLRPDLHLNPKPMLNSFCEDPLTKKLNLGIAWNRKKRKLSNELATGLELCNSFPGTHISDVNITQNSQCQPDLPSQDRGVPCSQHIVQSPIVTSQENNIMNGTISQSSASQFQSNYQLAVDSHQSVSNSLTPSSFVSSPKPNYNNCLSNLRKPSTLTLGEREKCGKVANQEHIIKKPKQEPLDFSQQQLPGRLAETTLDAELQRKNKLFKHRIEAEKSSRERTHDNAHPSLLMSSAQQAPLEGIPKLQHGMLTCRLKKKPTESNSFPSLDSQNTKSKCNIIGIRNNQSSLQQSQLLRSSPVMKADGPPTPMQWNHMGQSVGKNMTNVIFNQKGRASRNYQVFTGVGNASVSSCFNDSLPREASVSTKRKSNYLPKGLSMNRVESPANTSIMNTANAICPSVDSPMCRPSGIVGPVSILETSVPGPSVIGDPILDRVSKMKLVSQRYGLNQRKCKFSQVLERKQIFHTKLVALHLMHSRDKENSKDSHTNRTSYSRTLTFARSSHASQGNQIPSSEDQNKLILLEKLDEGMVEASAIYGHERNDPLELPLLQIFPGTVSAPYVVITFYKFLLLPPQFK